MKEKSANENEKNHNKFATRDLFILTSLYNEAGHIKNMIGRIDQQIRQGLPLKRLVIINDGSTDKTKKILEKFDRRYLIVFHRKENKGLSSCIRFGVKKILEEFGQDIDENSIFLKMDFDTEHKPQLLPELVKVIKSGHEAVVVSLKRPPRKRLLDWTYNRFFGYLQGKLLFGRPFSQSSPGLYEVKATYLEELLDFLTTYKQKYENRFGKTDTVGVDLASLTYFAWSDINVELKTFTSKNLLTERRPVKKIISHATEFRKHQVIMRDMLN